MATPAATFALLTVIAQTHLRPPTRRRTRMCTCTPKRDAARAHTHRDTRAHACTHAQVLTFFFCSATLNDLTSMAQATSDPPVASCAPSMSPRFKEAWEFSGALGICSSTPPPAGMLAPREHNDGPTHDGVLIPRQTGQRTDTELHTHARRHARSHARTQIGTQNRHTHARQRTLTHAVAHAHAHPQTHAVVYKHTPTRTCTHTCLNERSHTRT